MQPGIVVCGTCKCRGECKEGGDPALQNEVETFLLLFCRGFGTPRNMDTTLWWSVGSSTHCLLLGSHWPATWTASACHYQSATLSAGTDFPER